MSSNMNIEKRCDRCNKDFIAHTTKTKYCGLSCAQKAYKARKRAEKIEDSIMVAPIKQIADIRVKEILSVPEVAGVLGCCNRTVYRMIESGKLKASNLSDRLTRVKRSDIDLLFTLPTL